jgi:3-methyladenine DNA glycosylase AlkC
LEYSPKNTLKIKLQQFTKETNKYEEVKWTQSGTVNKIYLPELKKYQEDAIQTITAFSKSSCNEYITRISPRH